MMPNNVMIPTLRLWQSAHLPKSLSALRLSAND
ncbi:Uncharacterised protein [Vibrio cholerae]|nr:Uncharacterised protein [Vibrio cholerae]